MQNGNMIFKNSPLLILSIFLRFVALPKKYFIYFKCDNFKVYFLLSWKIKTLIIIFIIGC
jgi:hypothetical protein